MPVRVSLLLGPVALLAQIAHCRLSNRVCSFTAVEVMCVEHRATGCWPEIWFLLSICSSSSRCRCCSFRLLTWFLHLHVQQDRLFRVHKVWSNCARYSSLWRDVLQLVMLRLCHWYWGENSAKAGWNKNGHTIQAPSHFTSSSFCTVSLSILFTNWPFKTLCHCLSQKVLAFEMWMWCLHRKSIERVLLTCLVQHAWWWILSRHQLSL